MPTVSVGEVDPNAESLSSATGRYGFLLRFDAGERRRTQIISLGDSNIELRVTLTAIGGK